MIPHRNDLGKIETLQTEQFHCLVDARWHSCLEQLLAERPPAEWTQWQEVKRSTVRTIYQGSIGGPGPDPVDTHLKLFRAVRLSDRARDALGGSRSAKEFHNLIGARERGLPCVQPLAAGSIAGSLGSQSFLLTRTEIGEPLPRGALTAEDAGSIRVL